MPTEALSAYAPDPAFPYHIEETVRSGEIPLHGHRDYTELSFVLGGCALHRSGGEEWLMRRGDVLAADESTVHGFQQARDFRLCVIRFRLDALIPGDRDLRSAPGFRALFQPPDRGAAPRRTVHPGPDTWLRMESSLESALEAYRLRPPGYQTYLAGHLAAMAARLCQMYQAAPLPTSDGVARALAYLEDHYTEDIALSQLAGIAGVSARHFDRAFRARFSMTPRAYMTQLRMARARMLLAADRPITEIAFDCGYADSNYFSQVFRRRFGQSPQQYRKETKQG